MIELLLVYGSLRRHGSAYELMKGARFQGPALLRGYTLTALGGYPAALPCRPEADCVVEGELYTVPYWLLPGLDQYEGPLYERKLLTVEHGGREIRAWVYVARGSTAAWGPLLARWRSRRRGDPKTNEGDGATRGGRVRLRGSAVLRGGVRQRPRLG